MQNYDKKDRVSYSFGGWYEVYYLNGKLHRTDGPAVIDYYRDGSVEGENYYLNGVRHRTDGPACIKYSYSRGEEVTSTKHYLDGEYSPKSFYIKTLQEVINLPLELRLTDPRWWVRELKEEDIAKLR